MTMALKEIQERNLMRYDLAKKDRIIEGLKGRIVKMEAELDAALRHVDPNFVKIDGEGGFDFTTTDFGDQGPEVPIEEQVNAAGNRIADGIENGDYTVQQGDDIALVMDFMNETLQKTKARSEEREREFDDTVGELSIAQDKIYRIRLALED